MLDTPTGGEEFWVKLGIKHFVRQSIEQVIVGQIVRKVIIRQVIV
jgi:hypothetical protein